MKILPIHCPRNPKSPSLTFAALFAKPSLRKIPFCLARLPKDDGGRETIAIGLPATAGNKTEIRGTWEDVFTKDGIVRWKDPLNNETRWKMGADAQPLMLQVPRDIQVVFDRKDQRGADWRP